MNPKMKNLLVRTVSGAVFVALVITSFLVPTPLFRYVLFLFFAIVGTWEYVTIVSRHGIPVQKASSLILTIALVTLGFNSLGLVPYNLMFSMGLSILCISAFVITLILIPVIELFRKAEKPFSAMAHTMYPVLWVALPISLSGICEKPELVLALLFLIWGSDTFAYLGGSIAGKHKLFERISPKKTWEGSIIGGLLTCGLAVGLSYIPYFSSCFSFTIVHLFDMEVSSLQGIQHILAWIGLALIAVVFGTFGDLIESMFKRSYDIKDSGNIMPGHGGILDRLDSFLFALPVSIIYAMIISFFQ